MAHSTTIDVRFAECDPYNHVNHAVYATYFEVARTEALADCGVPLEMMAASGVQVLIVALDLRYKGAARLGDTLEVVTSVVDPGRVRSRWHQEIRLDGDLLVTADITAGITDATGKPIRPPEWLMTGIKPLLDYS